MAGTLQRSFEDLGTPLYDVPFVVVDLETTGGSPKDCEITEIGAVKYCNGELQGTFQTLVNPNAPIPPFITILTGITQAMVVEAPKIGEALPSFLEFLGDAVVVGHNVRFDLSFLNAAALQLGYGRLPNRSADTAALARRLVRKEVRNLKLGTLAAHFRSPVTPNHRALEDARATAHVFFELLERAGTVGVTHLEDLLQLPRARGSAHYAKIGLADELPRRPGVYFFKDRNGEVFYVGKAKNLRTRVRSYFYGDERRTIANMLRELDAIDYRACETDLEAQITELRLIQAHRPRYNRRSKPPKSSHYVKLTREAFPRLSLVRTIRDDGLLYLGPYRSRRSAEVVMTALWDAVPIRRCVGAPSKRSHPCAYAQMGNALCPCGGSVGKDEYRAVVDRLIAGIDDDPHLLLEPLRERMAAHARAERFEEAAWLRDRYQALARTLRRRRAWQAMQRAGMIVVDGVDGGALVDHGRLAAAWAHGDSPPLAAATTPVVADPAPVPESVGAAEEAHLIWTWLLQPGVSILDAGGPLSLPVRPVPELAELDAA